MRVLLIFSLFILFASCDKKDTDNNNGTECDSTVILDIDLFNATANDGYHINSATLEDDCLEVEISSSGCDGSTWEVDLIDSEDIAESEPVQRFLKVKLVNLEECEAYITKSYSFDLSPATGGFDAVNFVLIDYDQIIVYDN